MVSNGNRITDDKEQAETFINVFLKAVDCLEIRENRYLLNYDYEDNGEVENAISKFSCHPSILSINGKVNIESQFEFKQVTADDVKKQFKKIKVNKVTTFNNIPCKILKDSTEVCIPIFTKIVNNDIAISNYPDKMKLADVAPVFKSDKKQKKDATDTKNYRPVSVLPSVSKLFEGLIHEQLIEYISKYLSPFLCGYRAGYSAQHALIALIEHWRSILDRRGYAGAVLMDLSKAFDCINHDLLIAKLHAYGFSIKALKMIKSYLSNLLVHGQNYSWVCHRDRFLDQFYLTFLLMTYFGSMNILMSVILQMTLHFIQVIWN